jgi:hypothetical protein
VRGDNIQNLMYCRLYDLPTDGDKKSAEIAGTVRASPADIYTLFMKCNSVNRARWQNNWNQNAFADGELRAAPLNAIGEEAADPHRKREEITNRH